MQARKKGQLKKVSQQADNEFWRGRRGWCRFFGLLSLLLLLLVVVVVAVVVVVVVVGV